jgi:hypothetical protein
VEPFEEGVRKLAGTPCQANFGRQYFETYFADLEMGNEISEVPELYEEPAWLTKAMECERCYEDARDLVNLNSVPLPEDSPSLCLGSKEKDALKALNNKILEPQMYDRWDLLYFELLQKNSKKDIIEKLPAFLRYYIVRHRPLPTDNIS